MGRSSELFMEIREKEIYDDVDDSDAEIYKQLHDFYENFKPLTTTDLEDLFNKVNKDE